MSLHLVADMQANYSRFVNRVRSSGTVWGLKILNGWAICPSNERDCDVYTFWSDNAYAERQGPNHRLYVTPSCHHGQLSVRPPPVAAGSPWPKRLPR